MLAEDAGAGRVVHLMTEVWNVSIMLNPVSRPHIPHLYAKYTQIYLAFILVVIEQRYSQQRGQVGIVKISEEVAQAVDLIGIHPNARLYIEYGQG